MPELPEVQTTVNGLNSTITGLKITDVWSDYSSPYFKESGTIKDRKYFNLF
ncbi:MAG: Formamidopyrimidine-DNA glycosylase N-terminal domain, partial [Candidatus Parcubacteria bacterium]